MKKSEIRQLAEKFRKNRDKNNDRGRSFIHVRHDIENMANMTVKPIISRKSTCDSCDNGGIGHVRKVGARQVCDDCFAAIVRSRILYG